MDRVHDPLEAAERRHGYRADGSALDEAGSGGATASPEPWPEPIPLLTDDEVPRAYPIDALPAIMRDAVKAYQAFGQQPLALVACSAMAAASLCVQALADVARDGNLVGPCSLNFLVVGESGERKTSADRRMRRAVRRWLEARREALLPAARDAKAMHDAWRAKRDGLLAEIKGAGRKKAAGKPSVAELQDELLALEREEPKVPAAPDLFLEDLTPEALAKELGTGWPTASLWSDEGGLVVGSHGMGNETVLRFLTLLNRLWDGLPFERKRTTAESFAVRGRRLTVSLMLQPLVLGRLLGLGDGAARGTGNLARFLLAWPESTMGGRLYRAGDLEAAALQVFDDRLTELLGLPLPADPASLALDPPVLALSPDGFAVWREYHDRVERALGPGGAYAELKDFAAKSADHAARIACVLHVVEHGVQGTIGPDTMISGVRLADWHLHEARRVLGDVGLQGEATDAVELLRWLIAQTQPVATRDILQRGPSRFRKAEVRDRALRVLYDRHQAREARRGRETVVELHPSNLRARE